MVIGLTIFGLIVTVGLLSIADGFIRARRRFGTPGFPTDFRNRRPEPEQGVVYNGGIRVGDSEVTR